MYYKITIDKTSKPMGRKEGQGEGYNRFHQEVKTCEELKEAKEYLKEKYGKCKRVKIYQDPEAKHIGYIYCFKSEEYSNGQTDRWYQQDWIVITEVKETIII
ncbi:MAG: hypothetical protein KJ725_20360 [Gammaproteobacteria bacterium]|nr:hypothetical protein [Gammaproteobacteria bacterium]